MGVSHYVSFIKHVIITLLPLAVEAITTPLYTLCGRGPGGGGGREVFFQNFYAFRAKKPTNFTEGQGRGQEGDRGAAASPSQTLSIPIRGKIRFH